MDRKNLANITQPLIRWGVGISVGLGLAGVCCFLLPTLSGSCAAFLLTAGLATIIGLQIALPPINPEDDWTSRLFSRSGSVKSLKAFPKQKSHLVKKPQPHVREPSIAGSHRDRLRKIPTIPRNRLHHAKLFPNSHLGEFRLPQSDRFNALRKSHLPMVHHMTHLPRSGFRHN